MLTHTRKRIYSGDICAKSVSLCRGFHPMACALADRNSMGIEYISTSVQNKADSLK